MWPSANEAFSRDTFQLLEKKKHIEDMQKVPFPVCSGDSGRLQAGRHWVVFGRREAEDAKGYKKLI